MWRKLFWNKQTSQKFDRKSITPKLSNKTFMKILPTERDVEIYAELSSLRTFAIDNQAKIQASPEASKRFCLACAFPTYRAFNHMGEKFSTETNLENPTINALRQMDINVKDTADYLQQAELSYFKLLFMKGHLKSFVEDGITIDANNSPQNRS